MDFISVDTATSKIFQLICQKANLQDMLDLGSDLLNTEIVFFDMTIDFKAISHNNSHLLRDIYYIQNKEEFLSKIGFNEDNTPFILVGEDNKRLLVSKSYYAGNYIGHIAIPELNIPLEDLNNDMVRIISDACALSFALMDNTLSVNNCLEPENGIFEELLYGKYKTLSDFNIASKFYSFKDYDKFCTICFVVEEKRHKKVLIEIINSTKDLQLGFWTTSYNDNMAALIGWNHSKQSFREIIREIEKVCIKNNIIIGIGDPFSHMLQTRQNYINAEKTTIFSNFDDSNKKIFFHDDYKFNVFISDMNLYIGNYLDYLSFKVMDILKYDQNYNTEYATTLKTFLSASLSPQATADLLFIHKNTVIYRINKIKDLFDIDFTNTAQVFQLYFSFQLLLVRGWGKSN